MCSRLYEDYVQKRIDEIEEAMSAAPPMAGPSRNPEEPTEPEMNLVGANDNEEATCV
jgi:hypothetical protein